MRVTRRHDLVTLLALPVGALELTWRVRDALEGRQIVFLLDLVQKKFHELLAHPGFGRGSLREINTKLGKLGLRLEMEVDPTMIEEVKRAIKAPYGM